MSDTERLIEHLKLNDLEALPELAKIMERSPDRKTIREISSVITAKTCALEAETISIENQLKNIRSNYLEFLKVALRGTFAEVPVKINDKKQEVTVLGWHHSWLYGYVTAGHKIAFSFREVRSDRPNCFQVGVREVNKHVNQTIFFDLHKYLKYFVSSLTDPNYQPIKPPPVDLWGDIDLP